MKKYVAMNIMRLETVLFGQRVEPELPDGASGVLLVFDSLEDLFASEGKDAAYLELQLGKPSED